MQIKHLANDSAIDTLTLLAINSKNLKRWGVSFIDIKSNF